MKTKAYRSYWQRNINVCFVVVATVLIFISGCSTTTKKTDVMLEPAITPTERDDGRVFEVPPPDREKYSMSPVVRGLLIKSKRKFDAKDFEAAADYIERGINIAPNDPMLWQRLASIRLEQGDFAQAKQLAKKSNILVETNQELRAINEDIINQANRLLAP